MVKLVGCWAVSWAAMALEVWLLFRSVQVTDTVTALLGLAMFPIIPVVGPPWSAGVSGRGR